MLGSVSQRIYTGRFADRTGSRTGLIRFLPWALAAITVLGQIVWILVGQPARTTLTILTVTTFFLASVTHAYLHRGLAWTAGYVSITVSFGWLIEVIGTTTKFPFGDYTYTGELGPALLSVPLVIPLAWGMVSYPFLLVAQRLSDSTFGTVFIGAWLLMSWDLFLDPQMVREGYWVWNQIGWELPGIDGIPLQNFLGWFLASLLLMFLLDRLPRKVASDALPNAMVGWIYFSNVLAAAVFFGTPGVALWGAACMGLVVFPWAWRLWSQPQW